MQMLYNVWRNARLSFPNDDAMCPLEVRKAIKSCWDVNPENRPTAANLHARLNGILSSLPPPSSSSMPGSQQRSVGTSATPTSTHSAADPCESAASVSWITSPPPQGGLLHVASSESGFGQQFRRTVGGGAGVLPPSVVSAAGQAAATGPFSENLTLSGSKLRARRLGSSMELDARSSASDSRRSIQQPTGLSRLLVSSDASLEPAMLASPGGGGALVRQTQSAAYASAVAGSQSSRLSPRLNPRPSGAQTTINAWMTKGVWGDPFSNCLFHLSMSALPLMPTVRHGSGGGRPKIFSCCRRNPEGSSFGSDGTPESAAAENNVRGSGLRDS